MTIFYLDACLPTSVGTLNATAVRPEGDGMGIGSEKKLENGFERFHRGSRTDDGGGGGGGGGGSGDGEPSENSVPTWLSEGKQNAASEESRDFIRNRIRVPKIAYPMFYLK